MDRQTFCSSQTTGSTARYAAALYRQGTALGPGLRGSWRLLGSWGAGAGLEGSPLCLGVGVGQPVRSRMLDTV